MYAIRSYYDALLEEMQREDGWLVSPALAAADDFDRVVVRHVFTINPNVSISLNIIKKAPWPGFEPESQE